MKTKTILAVITLTFLPNFGMAACSADGHAAIMSCSDGTVFDAATKACVPVTG